jgi:hypothetical protein
MAFVDLTPKGNGWNCRAFLSPGDHALWEPLQFHHLPVLIYFCLSCDVRITWPMVVLACIALFDRISKLIKALHHMNPNW